MLGMAMAFLAACAWGTSVVLARIAVQHIPPAVGAFLASVAGFVLMLILALAFNFRDFLVLPMVAFGWFAIVGVLNYPMGRYFSIAGLKRAGVARAAPMVSSAPLFATAWAISLGNEPVQPLTILGTAAIVCGLFIVLSEGGIWSQPHR